MTKEQHIKYWIESAENDLNAATNLLASNNYDWALFLGHLVLEKALKAVYVYNNTELVPPKTHNLIKLKELCGISLEKDHERFLVEANKFHIEARYPSIKQEFYKICTKDYAEKKFKKITEIFQWIKSQMK
jgi:HEPN domain-containing protein